MFTSTRHAHHLFFWSAKVTCQNTVPTIIKNCGCCYHLLNQNLNNQQLHALQCQTCLRCCHEKTQDVQAAGLPWWVTPRTTSSRKMQEPKLCPQAGPFVSWCSSIRGSLHCDTLWLASAASPTPIHYSQAVHRSSCSVTGFPTHFSLVLQTLLPS